MQNKSVNHHYCCARVGAFVVCGYYAHDPNSIENCEDAGVHDDAGNIRMRATHTHTDEVGPINFNITFMQPEKNRMYTNNSYRPQQRGRRWDA